MADDIPADWYPDAQGTIRWWDGRQWTEHVRDDSSSGGTPQTTTVLPSVEEPVTTTTPVSTMPSQSFTATPSAETSPRKPSYPSFEDHIDPQAVTRQVWLTATAVGLAAFFLGMGIGGRESQEEPAASAPTVVSTSSAELEQRQAALDQQQQELDDRQQSLDERERDLDEQASATPTPTPSPTRDTASLATSIDDETVEVGEDVQAGRYETSGPSDEDYYCDYTVSDDEAGDDVITDESVDDRTSVTLHRGEWFTSEGCETWYRD